MIHPCLSIFVLIALLGITSQAANLHPLPSTSSPDKQTVIVEEAAKSGDRDYYFMHKPSGKQLGNVLPAEQRHQISNVAIIASWNRSSSKVALLVFYGTKLSELLVYERDAKGMFRQVMLQEPNAESVYQKQKKETIPQDGDGYSENAVGSWLDDDTVCLVSGEAYQSPQFPQHAHVYVSFKAHIQAMRATVSDIQLFGPLSGEASEVFTKKWGQQYFQPKDE